MSLAKYKGFSRTLQRKVRKEVEDSLVVIKDKEQQQAFKSSSTVSCESQSSLTTSRTILNKRKSSEDSNFIQPLELFPNCEPVKSLLIDDLGSWATNYNVSHASVTALLKILKKHNVSELPTDSRSLVKSPRKFPIRSVPPGHYCHRTKRKVCNPQVSILASVGGSGDKETTYRVMGKLMTETLANAFSYAGIRGKKSFSDLDLKTCVCGKSL